MPIRPLPAALLALAASATLAGCYAYEQGPRADRRADRVPPARIVGPDEACIPLSQIRETRVRDDHTIDFLSGSRRGWRNVLPNDCPSLGFEEAFSYNTSLSQLCSTDIIRVLDRSGGGVRPGAACGLGRFTPIELRR